MVDLPSEIAEITRHVAAPTVGAREIAASQESTQESTAVMQPAAFPAADQPSSKMAPMTSKFMAPWQQRSVEAYISANLHATIRMADLARVALCTPSRFHRSFKRSFGCTPYQYVIRRRIARSQRLMTISNESLIRISAKCGFVDQFHLRNMFRKVVGQPPGAWRRIHARPDRADSPLPATPPSLNYLILSESTTAVPPITSESPS